MAKVDTSKCEIKSSGKSITVRTAKGRLSYPSLFTPSVQTSPDGKTKERYSASLIFPKTADLSALEEAVTLAAEQKFGKDFVKKYPKLKRPFLQTADYPTIGVDADAFPVFIRTSADPQYGKPGVVDHRPEHVTDPSEVYAGRWALLTINVKAYDTAGNRGVTCYLNNVQVLEHDESLSGGRRTASEDFEAVEVSGDASELFKGGA